MKCTFLHFRRTKKRLESVRSYHFHVAVGPTVKTDVKHIIEFFTENYAKQYKSYHIQVKACDIKDVDSLKIVEEDENIIVSFLNDDIMSLMPGNKYIKAGHSYISVKDIEVIDENPPENFSNW